MQCVLHIGAEKTGSTVIQDWIYSNKETLSKKRVFLSPSLGRNSNNRNIVVYFKNDLDDWALVNKIETVQAKNEHFADFEENFRLEAESAAKDHDIFLITSEHFHSRLCSEEEIQNLRSFLLGIFSSVKVVCYFREQVTMAFSAYSTSLKSDCSMSLSDFLETCHPDNYYFNHLAVADRWSKIFGRENCEFAIYDKRLFPSGDVRMDFLSRVLEDAEAVEMNMEVEVRNPSLDFIDAEVFRVINEKMPFWIEGAGGINPANIAQKNAFRTSHSNSESMPIFANTKIQTIREVGKRFDDVNEKLLQKYFSNGEVFHQPAAYDAKQLDVVMLCSMVRKQFSAFLDQINDLKLENSTLKNDIDRLKSDVEALSATQTAARDTRGLRRLFFTFDGRLKGWIRQIVMTKQSEPRPLFRRVVYKKNGTVREIFASD